MSDPRVLRVTGGVVDAAPVAAAALYELVRVGDRRLLGEVIRLAGDQATLQVYEDTTGLEVGAAVTLSGHTVRAELGPGLLGSILDGLGRPLPGIALKMGDFIQSGTEA